nr:hypothetical protein [Tanacetum cinerariifolium]
MSASTVVEIDLTSPLRSASVAIFIKIGVLQIGIRAMVIENKGDSPPKDAETPVESSILVSTSSSVGSSSPVRSITPPPNYPFDESIFAELDNSLWIILRPMGSKPVPEEPNESDAYLWK